MGYQDTLALRQQQASEGRRMTLTAKKEASRPPKKPFIAKGHDAILKALQDSQGVVKVYTIAGRVYEGVVLARDRYTITLGTAKDKAATLYKHAIEAFVPQEAA